MSNDDTPRHPSTGAPLTGAALVAHRRGLRISEQQTRREHMLAFRRQVIAAAAAQQRAQRQKEPA